ncbi:CBM96 family carbohydrate-binding protein [Corallococcus terminator]|uniref:CBM96 family carbohydrate-binding protein n=1 Tax=Corallococcus terminator TaxID=2316733 RepID=UPI001FC96D46|nr:DNRLRE domain-containing protein [Corallococcus terminator]
MEENSHEPGAETVGTEGAALTTRTVVLEPTADAHVEAAFPTTRFGSSSTLKVAQTPTALTYLRFSGAQLPVAGTVTSARLRLFALNNASEGVAVHSPTGVHTWNEDVTWDTRPSWSDSWLTSTSGSVSSGTWVELDVSGTYFPSRYYNVSYLLSAKGTDSLTFASGEYAEVGLRPQLVLTVESGEDNPPPPPAPLTLSGAPVSFAASADTFVSADSPTVAQGSATTFKVDSAPMQEAYLRFPVQGLTEAVQRAVLRLYVSSGSDEGPAVYALTGQPWSESIVTWNSRPARTGSAVDAAQGVATGSWVDYDVTDLVRGNGDISFGLYSTSSDGVTFHSRESANASLRPQLRVWTGASKPAPTDACLTRTEYVADPLPALHDTYAAADAPDTKFQHRASLRVDADPREEAFLRFDVQLRPERIQRVALRLYAIDGTGNGPRLYRATAFEGATTDWNHRPTAQGEPLVDLGAVSRDAWVELDVTNVVTASGTYAFALLPDSTNSVGFASTDAEEHGILGGAPRLVVTYESAPFCSYRGTKPSGTTAWVRQEGGAEPESPRHVAPAPDGGFAVVTRLSGTAPLAPASGHSVSLHRADGSVAWTRSFPQAGVLLEKVVVTAVGNVLVAGSYTGAPDLGKGALPQGSGIVVMKLTPTGTVDWTRGFRAWFDTTDDHYDNPMNVLDLATDAHGSAVLVGTFWGYTDFGTGPVYSGKPFPYDDDYPNSYVLKLQWDGAHLWSRVLATPSLTGTQARSVAVDASERVIVGGVAGYDTDFGGGAVAGRGGFVARYGVGGDFGWARVLSAPRSDVSSVAVLPDQRIAFTGNFNGYLSFAGQGYVSREPEEYDGPRDALVGVLTEAGGDVALRQFAHSGFTDMVVDGAGNIVTTQDGDGNLVGLGEVGSQQDMLPRPTLAAFGPNLESRWVRVLGPLSTYGLHLASSPDGLVVAGTLAQAFEVDGTWYTPRARRSDVLLIKLKE